ncbi:MAG: hypothetical protein WC985_00245 [Thermoplasmata archaeon]
MTLTERQLQRLVAGARRIPLTAPLQRFEDFAAITLGFNALERGEAFPDPDPTGTLAVAVAKITLERERILNVGLTLPRFVVVEDQGVYFLSGLATLLQNKGASPSVLARLPLFPVVRRTILRLERGHHLEAVGAAILSRLCDYAAATIGSGDQGIDAIAWVDFLELPAWLTSGLESDATSLRERVFVLGSAKAQIGGNGSKGIVIRPEHVRDLIGSWLIQRSSEGIWQTHGIRMLTPVQLLLITTYRLSEASRGLCHSLGAKVWGLPELTYLVVSLAPDSVFGAPATPSFTAATFRKWWNGFDLRRLSPLSPA